MHPVSGSPDPPLPQTPPNLHENSIDPNARWLVQKFGGTSVGKFAVKIARDVVSSVFQFIPRLTLVLPILLGRNYIDVHKIAVVCSARSGSTKTLGTTSLLLKASSEALQRPAAGAPKSTRPFTPGPSRTSSGHDWSSPLHSPDPCSPPRSVLPNDGLSSTLMRRPTLTMSSMPPPSEEDDLPFFATVDLIRSEHVAAARSSISSLVILKELEDEIEKDCDALRSFLMAIQVCISSRSRNPSIHPLDQVICEMSPRSKDIVIGFGEKMACKLMAAVLRDQVRLSSHQ